MGKVVRRAGGLTLQAVRAAIAFDQPKLRATASGDGFLVEGTYLLFERGAIANPAGPLSQFAIKIVLSERFPDNEPAVFETGGRIPWSADRHVNRRGDCCVTVWEHWLVETENRTFAGFLNGPLYEYFLGQYWYEKTGRWPFGERAHGDAGLIEAYAEVLGTRLDKSAVLRKLRLLSMEWPKGHMPCSCGSGQKLRHCHATELRALHERVPSRIAKRMFQRLMPVKAGR